ncbi:MAG: alpha/beta fold hydrolase [Calditrichia bacterium]|nr:alpha/beta fold hydrolase [Calditrichia bacterium]
MSLYFLLIIAIVLLVLIIVMFIRFLLEKSFYHPHILHSCDPAEFELVTEEIFMKTKNTKQIQTLLTKNESNKPLLILIHGWANTSDIFYPLAKVLVKKDWQILFVNARNHGKSDSDSFTTMVKFIEDLNSVLEFIKNKYPKRKIILIGHSLGAATSIYVSSKNQDILGLVSISSFSDVGTTMERSFLKKHMPHWIIKYVLKYVEYRIGLKIEELSPENNIKKIEQPLLLLHGTKDKIVPINECNQLYKRCGPNNSKQHIIEGANHSNILENDNTFKAILDFLKILIIDT